MPIIAVQYATDPNWSPQAFKTALETEFSTFNLNFHSTPTAIFASISRHPNAHTDSFYTDPPTSISACTDAALFKKNDLTSTLGLPPSATYTSAQLITQAYLKWGPDLIHHIEGDFSLVIIDPRTNTCFAARDKMGIRPLFYSHTPTQITLSSHPKAVTIATPNATLDLVEAKKQIIKPLQNVHPLKKTTLFTHVYRLLPAHHLTWAQTEPLQTRYWTIATPLDSPTPTLNEAKAQFKTLLKDAITDKASHYPKVSIEISGGLDSGLIAAYLQKYAPAIQRIGVASGTTIKRPPEKYRFKKIEIDFATAMAKATQTPLKTFFLEDFGPHPEDQILTLSRWVWGCMGHSSTLLALRLYKHLQKEGIHGHFSGFGGDEFISSQASLIFKELRPTRPIKAHYERTLKLLRNHNFVPTLINKFKKKTAQKTQFSAQEALHPDYQHLIDPTPTHHQNSQDRERNYYDGHLAQLTQDRLETSYLAGHYYGLTFYFPLLHAPLVQFFHQLPVTYKHRHGQGRYLFIQALKGYLPNRLRLRKTKKPQTRSEGYHFKTKYIPTLLQKIPKPPLPPPTTWQKLPPPQLEREIMLAYYMFQFYCYVISVAK